MIRRDVLGVPEKSCRVSLILQNVLNLSCFVSDAFLDFCAFVVWRDDLRSLTTTAVFFLLGNKSSRRLCKYAGRRSQLFLLGRFWLLSAGLVALCQSGIPVPMLILICGDLEILTTLSCLQGSACLSE
jgi:hypothetical protein